MQFADPRTDFAFKLIFGNDKAKEVLISFLNAVIGLEGIHAIAEVTILNPYQAPKISALKRSYLDVKCRDNRGVEFVVEMQVEYTEGLKKRIEYNACKAFTLDKFRLAPIILSSIKLSPSPSSTLLCSRDSSIICRAMNLARRSRTIIISIRFGIILSSCLNSPKRKPSWRR